MTILEKRNLATDNLDNFVLRYLDYPSNGFKKTFQSEQRGKPHIVVDSEWCRVSFRLDIDQFPKDDTLKIRYRRLHAPYDQSVMKWQGKSCFCWHRVFHAVYYIDGLSPDEVIENEDQGKFPQIINKFLKSQKGKKYLETYYPIFQIASHSLLWAKYGKRLFEIFDLRRPELWDKYSQFIKEYHSSRKLKPVPGYPNDDEIC
jgi:hypothetical protein